MSPSGTIGIVIVLLLLFLSPALLRASLGQPLRLHPASDLAGLAAGAGVAGFALRPSPLPIGCTASSGIKGSPRLARVLAALRAAPASRGRFAPLTPLPAKRPQVPRFSSGKGVKGETGSRTRSAARRASTERVRISGPQARPLMPLERPKPLVWGAVKEAKRPAGCTPDDRGRLAPFPPGREGRGDGWRARNAPFSRSPACRRGGGV